MDPLYAKIDATQKFTPTSDGIPPTDHTEQVNLGMEWAARQMARPQPPADPPKMPAIIPVAN